MDVLSIAAALATTLNVNNQGFRDCRVSEDSKRLRALKGKPMAIFASGADVYEYRE
jgi:hypothetical protein